MNDSRFFLKVRRVRRNIFIVLKYFKKCQPTILYLSKMSFKNDG